jgi:hypothetical protein
VIALQFLEFVRQAKVERAFAAQAVEQCLGLDQRFRGIVIAAKQIAPRA